mgnify:CR=1 FL=1|tara:strand:+ start:970 stop:1314 length:345 start_codon:yes stop_codon:yes gene_type:complete
MRNDTNKPNLFIAIGLGFLFVLLPNFQSISENLFINQDLIISLIIYSVLSYLAIYSYLKNKIAGIALLISISFISPNLYKNLKGELYPITITAFTSYLGYAFGVRMYKKWKSSL